MGMGVICDVGVEGAKELFDQVVGHRPGHLHTLQGVGDRGRFGGPDEDGEGSALALGLLEQEDRGVRLEVDPNSPQPNFDHV